MLSVAQSCISNTYLCDSNWDCEQIITTIVIVQLNTPIKQVNIASFIDKRCILMTSIRVPFWPQNPGIVYRLRKTQRSPHITSTTWDLELKHWFLIFTHMCNHNAIRLNAWRAEGEKIVTFEMGQFSKFKLL